MANYHKRNSIRAVQWAPENAQSFEEDSLFTVSPETFELMYKSDESRKW